MDAGFLELVRYGVRRPDDPIIIDSLRVVDAILKVDTPFGVVWRRYNHDGYGEGENGEPYEGYGRGRAWPLLTGERGHYEIAAGRDPTVYIRSMEGFATPTGLLPEQVWDQEHSPNRHLRLGRPTAAAVPLMWAHAEYLKILRSVRDGRVFDLIPEIAERYLHSRHRCRLLQVWRFLCPALSVLTRTTLRIIGEAPFLLHWSSDRWQSPQDTMSKTNLLSVHYVDIDVPDTAGHQVVFTFYWPEENRWEGRDFSVEVVERGSESAARSQ